ncbi:MAG: hypothetical protein J7K54_04740 [Candidatus Aenigmarchaeota archaeon]|nr:hypothetical protein [Candidatus Aenigmarchaeota archaeon]
MTGISKNLLAVLMILTIIISLVGTLTAIYSMQFRKAQTLPEANTGTAKVSVNLLGSPSPPPEPVTVTGKVAVYVTPKTEGGK